MGFVSCYRRGSRALFRVTSLEGVEFGCSLGFLVRCLCYYGGGF